MAWWTRPLVRFVAALLLPLAIPAVITAVLWILPGDPAAIICPPGICDGTEALAERWGLDQGPIRFYTNWLSHASRGELGNSWRVESGVPLAALLWESVPATAMLCTLAFGVLLGGSVLSVVGVLPTRLDPILQAIGLAPAVIGALVLAAYIEITYGPQSYAGWPGWLRLGCGALVLGIADGALAGAVVGARTSLEEEVKQRYIQIALLRGESALSNALPNVLPAWTGQMRARVLHIMSGAVVVEVVMGIPGLGELLFDGTLSQDFGVVLAAAWAFSLMSAVLLIAQAGIEIAVATWVRRYPRAVIQ